MLIVMADESGFQTDGYFGMAGYIAEEAEWRALSARWRAALLQHGAPYLHMKDLVGFREVYEGWTEGRRRPFLSDLIDIIEALELRAIGAVMKVADFRALTPEQRERFIAPYFMVWQELIYGTGIHETETFPGEKLQFVYSRQDDFASKMRWLWNHAQRERHYGASLGDLRFADMRDVPGLQAVDLLAYEFRHHYHLRDARPDLPMRIPLARLITHQQRLGAHMLKYIPEWLVWAQANGVAESMIRLVNRNPERYAAMKGERQPPGVDAETGTARMRVLEKYIPLADTLAFRSILGPEAGPAGAVNRRIYREAIRRR
jgi:hypothetical protein